MRPCSCYPTGRPKNTQGTPCLLGGASEDEPGRGVLSFHPTPFEVGEGGSRPGGKRRKLPQSPAFCFLNAFSYMLHRPDIVGSTARGPPQSVCECPVSAPAPNSKKETHNPWDFLPRGVFFGGEDHPSTSENAPGCFYPAKMFVRLRGRSQRISWYPSSERTSAQNTKVMFCEVCGFRVRV